MTRARRVAAAAAVATLALATAACGTTDALVGLRPAPTESSVAAPLDADGARAIAARLLDGAHAAATAKGDAGHDARAEVLAGDALAFADAAAARGAAGASDTQLAKGQQPTVLAQSRGRQWPRAILATTLDETTSTRYLHVMVSGAPEEPFRITSSVPMLAGAELPGLGAQETGAPLVELTDGEGLPTTPAKAFAGYAAGLARPAPKKAPAGVSAKDPFGVALTESAGVQAKALGKLASFTQKHSPALEDAVAFRLADGGVVAFGMMRRADTITVRSGAKELVLPKRYATLVGKSKVKKSVTLTSLEPVVLVVPAEGDATAIGATELLVAGKGS